MSNKTRVLASALLLSFAGSAFSTTTPDTDIGDINKIYYSVYDRVARVYAQVDSAMEKKMIENLLVRLDNIDEVESLIVIKE